MKKLLLTTILAISAIAAQAMTYERARQEALFLTDKMAYELNLNEQQYNDCYEINLDYLLSIQTEDDIIYGDYLAYRNADLRHILFDWQWSLFAAADYFLNPVSWIRGAWYFPVYRHYTIGYYYYDRPRVFWSYRGGHGRFYFNAGFYAARRPHHWAGGFRGYDRGPIHRPNGGFQHRGGHPGGPIHPGGYNNHGGRSGNPGYTIGGPANHGDISHGGSHPNGGHIDGGRAHDGGRSSGNLGGNHGNLGGNHGDLGSNGGHTHLSGGRAGGYSIGEPSHNGGLSGGSRAGNLDGGRSSYQNGGRSSYQNGGSNYQHGSSTRTTVHHNGSQPRTSGSFNNISRGNSMSHNSGSMSRGSSVSHNSGSISRGSFSSGGGMSRGGGMSHGGGSSRGGGRGGR